MALRLVTPPVDEPVTIEEAKRHLRVDDDEEDAFITALVMAARQHVDGRDGRLGRALVTQTWELVLDAFPRCEIRIPLPPLRSVEAVVYRDVSGVDQTLEPSAYIVDAVSEPGRLMPVGAWPATEPVPNAVTVRFVAGYGDAAAVPAPIKAALLLHVGQLYANREVGADLSPAALALLSPYRMFV